MSRQNNIDQKQIRRLMRLRQKAEARKRIPSLGLVLPRGSFANLLYLKGKGLV